jgi:serine/threonine-protein kinase RsbW
VTAVAVQLWAGLGTGVHNRRFPPRTRQHDEPRQLPSFAAEVVALSDTARPHLYIQLAAASAQVGVARSQVAGWTRMAGFPSIHTEDIVLATDEAVSNAVDHAYRDTPGTLTVFAAFARTSDSARVIISDNGLWRPPSRDPGFRGRGLTMMEGLAEHFRLIHTRYGTTVVLGWSLPG